MSSESLSRHPDILWAESPAVVWLTVVLPEKCLYEFRLSSNKIVFDGHSKATPDKKYAFELEFKEEIIMNSTDSREYGYNLFLEITKKKVDSFWGRLTKSDKRNIFVKTDFKRYKDPEFYDEPEFDDKLDIQHLVNGIISQKKSEMGSKGAHGLPKFKIEENHDFMKRLKGATTEAEFQALGEEESRLKMAFMRDAVAKQEQDEEDEESTRKEKELPPKKEEDDDTQKKMMKKKKQEVKKNLESTLELMKGKEFEGKEALHPKLEAMVKRYTELTESENGDLDLVMETLDSLGEEDRMGMMESMIQEQDRELFDGMKSFLSKHEKGEGKIIDDDVAYIDPKLFSQVILPVLPKDHEPSA